MASKASKKTATAQPAHETLTPNQFRARVIAGFSRYGKNPRHIAISLGYEPGTGQNRVVNCLVRAGLYQRTARKEEQAA